MEFCKDLIESKLVHKTTEDDVLIFKPEIVIKSALTKNEYDILVNISEDVKKIINSVYYKASELYVLRTLPYSIDKEMFSSTFTQLNLDDFYTDNKNGDLTIIPTYVPLHVEEILRSKLRSHISPVAINEKKIISSLGADAPVNSYLLKNNTNDYYFYKKDHEHIPGMMLIESARQAVYDYVYTNSGHEFNTVSISMSKLDVEFFEYSISTYPLEFLFSHVNNTRRHRPKTIEKKAWFYQRGKLTGTFTLKGGIIPKAIFNQVRNEKYPKKHVFMPYSNNQFVEVKDEHGNSYSLKVISLSFCSIILEQNNNMPTSNIYELKINDMILPIQGTVFEGHYITLELSSLSKIQNLIINNIINTYYYHRNTFELVGLI